MVTYATLRPVVPQTEVLMPPKGTAPRFCSDRLWVSAYGLGRTTVADCAAGLRPRSLKYAKRILEKRAFQLLVVALWRLGRITSERAATLFCR